MSHLNGVIPGDVESGEAPNAAPVSALLQGFDTFVGSARSTALTGTIGPGTQANQLEYAVCFSTEELYEAVGLSVSVGASSLFASVDVKAQFVSEIKTAATSVSIVVHSSIATAKAFTDATLIRTPPTPVELARFYRGYGDSFVSQLTTGAEYLAVYTFYAEDEEAETSVKGELKVAGLAGGSVDAELQASLDRVRTKSSVQTQVRQLMTGVSGVPYPDTDSIIRFALDFPKLPISSPAVLSFGTTGYENVPGMPPMRNIVRNRMMYLGTAGTLGISEAILRLETAHQQCVLIQKTYDLHTYTADTAFAEYVTQNGRDRRTAAAWMADVEDDPNQTYSPPSLPSLKRGFPSITIVRNESPKWGEDTFNPPFIDVPKGSAALGWRLDAISVSGDAFVDGLIVSYTNADKRLPPFHHGNTTGATSLPLVLVPGEVITSISGAVLRPFNRISLLSFTTSVGQTLSWPPNFKGGDRFTWDVPEGQTLVGFQGKGLDYLTQLQAITISLAPATFVPFLLARAL